MGTELDTIRWHLVEARGGGDARHEIDGAFAALARRLAGIERDVLALKPVASDDGQSDYEVLRDAIIELLDPPDDDAAEAAILIEAVEDLKRERDMALAALALSVEIVQALLRANDGRPLGDELRDRVMEASEAAARVLAPWQGKSEARND